jgi:hypothetical protein
MATQALLKWLSEEPTQQRIFCCDSIQLESTYNGQYPWLEDDAEIAHFMEAISSNNLSTQSPSTALTLAAYVIEVSRMFVLRDIDVVTHARYFVPTAPSSTEYVEVHAKDAFGGTNLHKFVETQYKAPYRFRQKWNTCDTHQPQEGKVSRFVTLIGKPGSDHSVSTTLVTGRWLIDSEGDDWGT